MRWRFTLIEVDGSTTHVIEEPIGWNDIVFVIRRDVQLHGIFFEFTTPLKFYGDAYVLIRDEYELKGVEGFLNLIIDYQCNDTDPFSQFYNARLNFTKLEFVDEDLCLVEIPIEDNSCLTLFKSRQDQKVDLESLLSLDGTILPDYSLPTTITLLPKTIRKTDKVFLGDGTTNTIEQLSTTAGANTFTSFLWAKNIDGIAELNGFNEAYDVGNNAIETNVVYLWKYPFLLFVTQSNVLLTVHYGFLLEIDVLLGNVTLDGCGPSDTFSDVTVNLKLRRNRLGVDEIIVIGTTSFLGCHDNFFSEDIVFDFAEAAFPFTPPIIQTDDEVSLYLEVIVNGTYTNIVPGAVTIDEFVGVTDHDGNYFKVTIDTKYGATPADVILVNEALARSVESVTDKCLTVYSDYFGRTDAQPYVSISDGCGALEAITKGVFIRQIPNSQMLISFKELYDGLNSIHNLGMGLETDTDRIETIYSWNFGGVISCTGFKVQPAVSVTTTVNTILKSMPSPTDDADDVTAWLNTLSIGAFFNVGGVISVTDPSGVLTDIIITYSNAVVCTYPVNVVTGQFGDYQRVRIEQARFFYESTIILTCDKVPKIKRTVITQEHISIFNSGYSKWEVEQFSGLDEFNTKRSYRSSLQTIKNAISQVSGIIASGYSIEIARQAWSVTSRDFRYDNDIFIICVERGYSEPFVVEQGNINSPSNLIDPGSVYNFRLSPNRNILRWLPQIMASYRDVGAGQIFYMSGEANVAAEGFLNSGCVQEVTVLSESEEVINPDTLADPTQANPFYILELWEFDYPMTVLEYLAVLANPRGRIRVRYGLQTAFVECYIREIDYKPNQGMASFKLLPRFVPEGEIRDDYGYDYGYGYGYGDVEGDFDRRDFEPVDFFTN